ncbi:MAG: type II secretion system protein [bacterium]|nr:type II secretion system protein [bacterium]
MKSAKNNFKRGFTLLEMIVSLGVFSIAILISLSSIFSISDAQKKAVALQNALDNLRFAIEAASKEIRTGSSFHCGSDISLTPQDCGGGAAFTFLNADGETVSYYQDQSQLLKKVGAALPQSITAVTVKIERLVFYVSGAPSGDGRQPRVTIVIEGKVSPTSRTETTLQLETTVSQRKLDS